MSINEYQENEKEKEELRESATEAKENPKSNHVENLFGKTVLGLHKDKRK
jgi:hypothetical protein